MRLELHSARAPRRLFAVFAVFMLASCATASRDRDWVSDEIERRVGHGIRTSGSQSAAGVVVEDGLDEDETAALALYSSPAFLADMARLSAARADFDEAARPDNPRLSVLGPVGVITAATTLVAPIMSFFQIPQRTEAAGRALESVAESLVQSGLNLVRDARIAHIDRLLAGRRLAILQTQLVTAEDLAQLSELRASAGDVSPGDALVVRSQAALAADAVAVAQRDVAISNAALLTLLGLDPTEGEVDIIGTRELPSVAPPLADLIAVARRARPDVRAAELELEGTGARVGFERSRILSISLQSDVQWNNAAIGARLGGSVELPIFNQNQGGIGRAEAAVEGARHRLEVVRQQVVLEVITAQAQLEQALASHARFQTEIVPPLEGALEAATQQYELGEAPYLVVLDAVARLSAAQLGEVELEADARRAHAQLERSVGARIEVAMEAAEGQQ